MLTIDYFSNDFHKEVKMRVTKIIHGKNGKQTKMNISTGGDLFIQTGRYISDGRAIIKSEYVNKIFFHPSVKNILSPLPTQYTIINGSMEVNMPSTINLTETFENLYQQETRSSTISDFGLQIRSCPYQPNAYKSRLLFLKDTNEFMGVSSKYEKILDGGFSITANAHMIFLKDGTSENRVAIVMASYVNQEIETLKEIFSQTTI